MKTGLVKYNDDNYNVEIDVCQCSLRQGFKRDSLHTRAQIKLKAEDKARESSNEVGAESMAEDLYRRYVLVRTHPELIAASVEVRNLEPHTKELSLDITGEEFMDLPETLVFAWEKVVYSLNPHWLPSIPKEEDKKQGEVKEPDNN